MSYKDDILRRVGTGQQESTQSSDSGGSFKDSMLGKLGFQMAEPTNASNKPRISSEEMAALAKMQSDYGKYRAQRSKGISPQSWFKSAQSDYDARTKALEQLRKQKIGAEVSGIADQYNPFAPKRSEEERQQRIDNLTADIEREKRGQLDAREDLDYASKFRFEGRRDDPNFNRISAEGQRKFEKDRSEREAVTAGQRKALTNPTSLGSAFGTASFDLRTDKSYKEPTEQWTQDQRALYSYLYAQDPEEADAYAQQVNDAYSINKRLPDEAKVSAWAEKHPVLATAGSIAAGPVKGGEFLADIIEYAHRGTVTQKDYVGVADASRTATGTISQNLNEKYGTLDEDLAIIGGKGWGDAYQLGESILSSMTYGHALGAAGTSAVFFGSAAKDGFDEAMKMGVDPKTALYSGFAQGTAEALFEYLSIDKLINLGPATSIKGYITNIFAQAGIEASEEMTTSIANTITDGIIMADKSQINMAIDAYMAEGMSFEEAQKKAYMDNLQDIAFDALGGAISGGISGGLETGVQNTIDKLSPYEGNTSKLMQTAEKASKKTDNGKLLEIAKKRLEKEKVRNLDVDTVEKALRKNDVDLISRATENRLKELGETGDTAVISRAAAKQTAGQMLSLAEARALKESKYGERVSNELNPQNIYNESHASGWAEGIGTSRVNRLAYNLTQIQEEHNNAVAESQGVAAPTVENLEDTEYANKEEAVLKETVAKMGISPESGEAIINAFTPGGELTAEEYSRGVQEAFRFGYEHIPESQIRDDTVFTETLTDEQLAVAYKAGVRAAAEKVRTAPTVRRGQTKEKGIFKKSLRELTDSKVAHLTKDMTERQRASIQALHKLSQAIGVDFYFFESYKKDGKYVYKNAKGEEVSAPHGWYEEGNGSIHIDINAGYNGENAIMFTAAHELTHFIKEWSEKEFDVLNKFLFEQYGEAGQSVDMLIRQKMEAQNIGRDEALEEVVADSMQTMLTDGNVAQKLALLKNKDQSLWKKIRDFFKKLFQKVAELYEGLDPYTDEGRYVAEMKDKLEEFQNLFTEGLAEASENFNKAEMQAVEQLGSDAKVETNAAGELLIAENEEGNTLVYSERTYKDGGRDAMVKALKENGHTDSEIKEVTGYVDDILSYLKNLTEQHQGEYGYQQLADNLQATIVTNIKTGRQVLSTLVSNGDYPVNLDLTLTCKKRVAYMKVMNRLIQDGVFDNVIYDGEAIAKVNEILRGAEFETACLGCFVESRRLQFQNWADTIVSEWNDEVKKRNPNAPAFNFASADVKFKGEDTFALTRELEGAGKKNAKGNLNLGTGNVKTKMGRLLDKLPSMQRTLTTSDLLNPEGLKKLRAFDTNLFSIVQQRYGAASPKIVQEFNPYASEIALMSFSAVKNYTGHTIKGAAAFKTSAKKKLIAEGKDVTAPSKAEFNRMVEREAIREYLFSIGGARMQSFSDFMISNTFDYFQMFADLAARRYPMHGYTKEAVCLRLFGMTGAKWNGSLIAHVEKSLGKEYAGLMPAGSPNTITVNVDGKKYGIGFDDYARHAMTKGTAKESFIQSIGMKDVIALQLDPRYADNVGSITIGVSDKQILAMLDSDYFRMVIPYHSSGMLPIFAKLVGVDNYNDYSDYQETKIGQYYAKDKKTKLDKLKGKADMHYDYNEAVQRLGDAKAAADEYIAWCNKLHPVISDKKVVGYVTFKPKFSDSPYHTDFTKHPKYYKLLEDFNSYNNLTQQSALQKSVEMRFPSEQNALSGAALEKYKSDLRETGIFTEKDVEKYAKKAQMSVKEIIQSELNVRKAYGDQQAPKFEGTIKKIEDTLSERPKVKLSARDSEGNELSPGQQEFFKDSKVRDENGNLMAMYHGTDTPTFTVFDPQYSDDKRSLFFTSSPSVADGYTKMQGDGKNVDPYNLITAASSVDEFNKAQKSIGGGLEIVKITPEWRTKMAKTATEKTQRINPMIVKLAEELSKVKGSQSLISRLNRIIQKDSQILSPSDAQEIGFISFDISQLPVKKKSLSNLRDDVHDMAEEILQYSRAASIPESEVGGYVLTERNESYPFAIHGNGAGFSSTPGIFNSTTAVKKGMERASWMREFSFGNRYKVYLNLVNPLVIETGRTYEAQNVPIEIVYNMEEDIWNVVVNDGDFVKDIYLDELEDFIKESLDEQSQRKIHRIVEDARKEYVEDYGDDGDFEFGYPGARISLENADIKANIPGRWNSLHYDGKHGLKTREVSKIAKSQGYDGVIFKNMVDAGGWSYGAKGRSASTVAIAFDSNQIKSISNKAPTSDPDIRYSQRDQEYMDAIESGKTRQAQKMVNEAASEAGAISENGKPIHLFHGTPHFGFTTFRPGVIFLTDNPSIASGYTQNKGYGRQRKISEAYIKDDGSIQTLIKNARNVLGNEYRELTEEDKAQKVRELKEAAHDLNERINNAWTNEAADFLATLADKETDLDNGLANIFSLVGGLDENIDDFLSDSEYYTPDELELWLRWFDNHYERIREFFVKHYKEIKGSPASELDKVIRAYDLPDFAIDVSAKLLKIIKGDNLISSVGSITNADAIRGQIEAAKDVGSYDLYGFAGNNPLIVDGQKAFWTNVNVPELGGTMTTDEIAEKARAAGYTSVTIKNIMDSSMNNYAVNAFSDVYIFFDSSQVKSADPVTYDADGNVIPLSERFNSSNPDIRFSARDSATYEGKPFWSGSVNLTDGKIEEVHSVEDAIAFDFHHSMYFSEQQVEKMADGENGFFWIDGNNVYGDWREDIPRNIIGKIKQQIKFIDNPVPNSLHYSARTEDPSSMSNRELLATALETVAQNEAEEKQLRSYKKKVESINEMEADLHRVREQISELYRNKDPERNKKYPELKVEAQKIANRISIADKQLLRLEATKPMKDLLTRERNRVRTETYAKGRERLQEQREYYQESRRKAKEGRDRTAMRHKIIKVVKELNDYLLKSSSKKHVLEGMRASVAAALEVVNMDTVGAEERIAKLNAKLTAAKSDKERDQIMSTIANVASAGDKLKTRLEGLRTSYEKVKSEGGEGSAYDEVIAAKIDETIDAVGNTSIRDMSLPQLEKVHELYTMVLHSIREANKVFIEGQKREVEGMAMMTMLEEDKMERKRVFQTPFLQNTAKWFYNNETPTYFFKTLNSSTMTELFDNIRGGEDTWARDITAARDFFLSMMEKHNYKKWDFDKTYEFTTEGEEGKTFQLNLDQIMSLYAYSFRDQALGHLNKGGIVFNEDEEVIEKVHGIPVKYTHSDAHTYAISPELLNQIVSNLSEEQKAFARSMQQYLSTTMGEKGNEVSMQLYGVRLFKEENYWPLRVADQFLAKAKPPQKGERKLKNSGFTKPTVPKAGNPVVLTGFMSTWANHVNDMSMYHSFVLPLESFYRVYNYHTSDPEVPGSDKSVYASIQNAWGRGANQYIEELLKDLNGGAVSDPRETLAKKAVGKFKKAAVFASASVVIQQPSAIGRAFTLIDPKWFIGPKVDAQRHEALWAEVKKYAPVAIIKEMGYFDTNMGRSAEDFLTATGYDTLKEKAKAMVTDADYRDEVLSKAPALADEITWCAIWEACKREQKAKGYTGEKLLEASGKRFSQIVRETQVYDSVLSRSANMRSKSLFMNLATAFMAEPTVSINMLQNALIQGKRGDKTYARRAIGGVTTSLILNSLLVSLIYAARDDDDDDTFLEKYTSRLVSEIVDGINPLTYYPFIKDIWSAAQGFDIERADMTLIKDLFDGLQNLVRTMDTDTRGMNEEELQAHRERLSENGWKVVDGLSSLVGLPEKNIRRDINGGISLIKTLTKDFTERDTTWGSLTDKVWDEVRRGIPIVGYMKPESKQEKLYKATIKGDTKYADRLRNSYASESAADSALKSGLRESDDRVWAAAEARVKGNLTEYKRLAKAIMADTGLSQDVVVKAIMTDVNKLRAGEAKPTESKPRVTGFYDMKDFFNSPKGRASVKADLVDAQIRNGKTEDEALKSVESSISSGVRERFFDDELTEVEVEKILVTFAGKDDEYVAERLANWKFSKQNPDLDWDNYKINDYVRLNGELSPQSYDKYLERLAECEGEDKNGDGKPDRYSRQRQVIPLIDSLPISAEAKDTLFLDQGWAKSSLSKTPWHR